MAKVTPCSRNSARMRPNPVVGGGGVIGGSGSGSGFCSDLGSGLRRPRVVNSAAARAMTALRGDTDVRQSGVTDRGVTDRAVDRNVCRAKAHPAAEPLMIAE